MGIIIGKFRKKKTTLDVLENLEKRITSIEDYGKNTEQAQKRIVGRFLIISICVYLLAAFIFYFYFFPASFYDRLYYIIPLIFAPAIIASTRKVLTWYYHRKLRKNETSLTKLRNEKKEILEKVMDTETYKVAKKILEKFAPEQVRKSNYLATPEPSTPKSFNTTMPGVRQRAALSSNQVSKIMSSYNPKTPALMPTPQSSAITRYNAPMSNLSMNINTPVAVPLPREILPRERSVVDKMVEYLVGDGPSNRYALICKQCASHNGMALKEEFEYLSFRCGYCYTMNPARKKRLQAPKLEQEIRALPMKSNSSETSESEKNSATDSDSDEDERRKIKTLYASTEKKGSDNENEKASDFDKLSDLELKLSDNELGPIEKSDLGGTEKIGPESESNEESKKKD